MGLESKKLKIVSLTLLLFVIIFLVYLFNDKKLSKPIIEEHENITAQSASSLNNFDKSNIYTPIEDEDTTTSTINSIEDYSLNTALMLIENEQYEDAVDILLKLIETEPTNADLYAWLAACYGSIIDKVSLFSKLDYSNLMDESLETAMSLDAESTTVRMVRGNKFLNAPENFGGDVEKAIEEFKYCIENGMETATIFYSLGQAYEKKGEVKLAIESYESALKQDAEHAAARERLNELES